MTAFEVPWSNVHSPDTPESLLVPIDLRDGSEVAVLLADPMNPDVTDDDMTAEEIADLLTAMDHLEPLELSDEERSAWEATRQAQKEWEKAHFVERAETLRRTFE